jgi:hypothetical protein
MRTTGRRAAAGATLIVGLVALAIGLVAVLSHAERRLASANNVPIEAILAEKGRHARAVCQPEELVPAGTATLRVWLQAPDAGPGPAVRVTVTTARGTSLGRGARPAGWHGGRLDVPLDVAIPRDAVATVCATLAAGPSAAVVGAPSTGNAPPARGLPGRMRIEYLRAGRESWWALAGTIADRVGYGHGRASAWPALLAAALALAAAGTALWALMREAP